MQKIEKKIGNETLIFESGLLAKQANGAVVAKYGDSFVLATVCCSSSANEELDYIPLHVEYNEKYYAAGKIPGGFFKREGRPKEREILVSRLIDRPLRPLFSKSIKRDIQLIPTVLSTDQLNQPDVIAINAASAAVTISDIPFDGPVGAVRVGMKDGEYIINPPYNIKLGLNLVVAGTLEGVTMVEGGGQEISEDALLAAIEFAREPIATLCTMQLELKELCGKEKFTIDDSVPLIPNQKKIEAVLIKSLETACFVRGKNERNTAIKAAVNTVFEEYATDFTEQEQKLYYALVETTERDIVRKSVLEKKMRTDGRHLDEIRSITCLTDVLPRTHGSALFTRGETQALVVATLGTALDEQIMDDIEGDRREHFMLHYNFPPYSVGETGRLMTGRREIGHGNLAYRAIHSVLPKKNDFPYTIRLVSEILESNGSSSMATVCGSSMALRLAGVPLKEQVAGIAMGLIKEGDSFAVLSDILGEEDHLGDMDFKVAGTANGITAFQMDIKLKNVSTEILKTALEQARTGRLYILDKLQVAIPIHRNELSDYAPRISSFYIDVDKIGALIGPGGKTIKALSEKHESEIVIDPDGKITIYSKDQEAAGKAEESVRKLLEEPEIGKIYSGHVRRITDFGAFIEFLPGKDGLCHISRISKERVETVEDYVSIGDAVEVKIIEIDKMGRVNLSMVLDSKIESRPFRRPSHGDSSRRDGDSPRRGGDRSRRGGDHSRRGGDFSKRRH